MLKVDDARAEFLVRARDAHDAARRVAHERAPALEAPADVKQFGREHDDLFVVPVVQTPPSSAHGRTALVGRVFCDLIHSSTFLSSTSSGTAPEPSTTS